MKLTSLREPCTLESLTKQLVKEPKPEPPPWEDDNMAWIEEALEADDPEVYVKGDEGG